MAGRIPGVFLSNLPFDADPRSIAEQFKRLGVEVTDIKVLQQGDGEASALVDLPDHATAEQVGRGRCCGLF